MDARQEAEMRGEAAGRRWAHWVTLTGAIYAFVAVMLAIPVVSSWGIRGGLIIGLVILGVFVGVGHKIITSQIGVTHEDQTSERTP